jgi:hypothetical protein
MWGVVVFFILHRRIGLLNRLPIFLHCSQGQK